MEEGMVSSHSTRRFIVASLCALPLYGCVEQSLDQPNEQDLKAARQHILSKAPTPKFSVHAQLDDKLVYLGCDVDTAAVVPGKTFTLTHYWKVQKPVDDGWKPFVHLASPAPKKVHLNADHVPVGGKYPMALWKKDEIIRDIHRVTLPASWPSNTVEIYVGGWKGAERMKVVSGPKDAENRVLAARLPVQAAQPKVIERKKIVARRVKSGSIKIDGKLNEPAWKEAASTSAFVGTLDGRPSEQATTAKLLWDDKNLYVAVEMTDPDVWSTLQKRDDKLWTEEAIEMFVDADGDGKSYIELQVNPKGAVFDSYLPEHRQNQNDWDSGLKAAIKIDGTLNNRKDVDKGWVVEFALPLDSARGKEKAMKNVPPVVGTEWRVNLLRLDLPKSGAQVGTAWSPPMVADFHALDKFGVLVFGDEKGLGGPAVAKDGATSPSPNLMGTTPSTESTAQTDGGGKKAVFTPVAPMRPGAAMSVTGGPHVVTPVLRSNFLMQRNQALQNGSNKEAKSSQ
jgi:hypothetical protein